MPPEMLERQLNYADIDLTLPTRASRKSLRKASQKSIKIPKTETIDYAMIDMEATVAIQRAGQEHKMSRVDSLRRASQPKLSLSTQAEEFVDTVSSISMPSVQEGEEVTNTSSVPDDFKVPISATHKYVNVPPPKDQTVSQSDDMDVVLAIEEEEPEESSSNLADEILAVTEKILLPIRQRLSTSSSDEETEEESSSDDEVLIVE